MNYDIHDIRRKVQASREFSKQLGGAAFTLRLPTEHDQTVAYAMARSKTGDAPKAAEVIVVRSLLEQAIVGWNGVMLSHLVTGHAPDETLEWDEEIVPLLLDAQPAWANELAEELVMRIAARRAPLEAAEKN